MEFQLGSKQIKKTAREIEQEKELYLSVLKKNLSVKSLRILAKKSQKKGIDSIILKYQNLI
ncbi:hypothetical protein [Flexithrix dorotheae]|uniref:hypothetical protein n=1 Tax=Flexithrix dorotheae TaxID=70993 RepID=UPI00037EA7AE|nr:hypothetical protein [Flexithrix dorotheae]